MKIGQLIDRLNILTKHHSVDPIIGFKRQDRDDVHFLNHLDTVKSLNDVWHDDPSPQYQDGLIITTMVHEFDGHRPMIRTAKGLIDALNECDPNQDIYVEAQADLYKITEVNRAYIFGKGVVIITCDYLEGYHT